MTTTVAARPAALARPQAARHPHLQWADPHTAPLLRRLLDRQFR